jgi:hypothetical protein
MGGVAVAIAALSWSCGSATSSPSGGASGASPSGASGAEGGSGGIAVGTAGAGLAAGGAAANAGSSGSGGAGSAAGAALGGSASSGKNPYEGLTSKPDVDTTPVASCVGQPDMTLCNVVTEPDRDYDICVGGVCVSPGCGDTSCNAPAPHFTIPPGTHHTYFEAQPGPEAVVVDLVTGLHWQACAAGTTGEKCEAGEPVKASWTDALAFCQNSTWAGKTDWYLPDPWEMLSIWDYEQHVPTNALDPVLFPGAAAPFPWTSTLETAERGGVAFAVQLWPALSGAGALIITEDAISELRHLRCTRRGFSRDAGYMETRFVRSVGAPEPVIEDKATGLMWQGCASGFSGDTCSKGARAPIAIDQFVAYCDGVVWAGHDDWRLPTYKELNSALRYPPFESSDPSIPRNIFVLDGSYLPGRTGLGDDGKMLLLNVRNGSAIIPTGTYPVTCVRWQ